LDEHAEANKAETPRDHVQELLWTKRESVQRKPGSPVSVFDQTDRRSPVRVDVRHSDAQGIHYAHRRSGYRQDHAGEPAAGLAAPEADEDGIFVQLADEHEPAVRFH